MDYNHLMSFSQSLNRSNLINRIRIKGWCEQERQYNAPSVYGNKAVTKKTRGMYKQYKKNNKHYRNL